LSQIQLVFQKLRRISDGNGYTRKATTQTQNTLFGLGIFENKIKIKVLYYYPSDLD
jgi:hypothetical protein